MGTFKFVGSGATERKGDEMVLGEKKRFRTDSYWNSHWKESVYIEVDELGKVIQAGRSIRGKPGKTHLVGIPVLGDPPARDVKVELKMKKELFDVVILVDLKVVFSSLTFQAQELYSLVVMPGFRHIDDWLTATLREVVLENDEVIVAFDKYAVNGDPISFVTELSGVLPKLTFPFLVMSNISGARVTIDAKTATAIASAAYGTL